MQKVRFESKIKDRGIANMGNTFPDFLVKNSKHILKEILLIHGRETLIYDWFYINTDH